MKKKDEKWQKYSKTNLLCKNTEKTQKNKVKKKGIKTKKLKN